MTIALRDFQTIWHRPLQQPLYDPPKPDPEPAPEPPPLELRLLGTVIEPQRTQAILLTGDGHMVFKSLGETIKGARITQIESEQVTVEYHQRTLTLTLTLDED